MKKLVQLLLLMTLPLVVIASPLKKGTLSVLLFSEGKPLANNEIKIDGKKVFKTDEDGAVKIRLVAGRHQIEIFGKNAAGENLGYFKKPVGVKEGRDTEIIATLSKTGADSIDIDTPVAVAKSVEREAEKATGEGRITGRVLSSEGNTPIAGARVFVRGTAVDVRTDEKGRFSAKVPSGKTLSISVVHSAYSAQTVGGIVVKKDGTTSRTIKLTPASMELEEFVVLAPKIEGSIADVMAEEKEINAIANILGSEEFSKKGDSDAAAALKRVTGVTLVDGKNIYVRGLGERYSNVEMNSLPLPSPNPTKRTVPLDIFPSSVIGSMKIQKSASANIPSSFGGGYIDVRTKEKFDEDFVKVSLGGEINDYTGTKQINYVGSSGDWTGYDGGYREIPQELLDASAIVVGEVPPSFDLTQFTKEELSNMTSMFINRVYGLYWSTLDPGFSGSIEGAKSFAIDDENEISIYGNYSYGQKNKYVQEDFYGYDFDIDGNLQSEPSKYGTIDRVTNEISHGGLLNIGYNYSDVFSLKYTKLYTKNSDKRTRLVDGIIGSDYAHLALYYLDWEEREMDVDQLNGEFDYQVFNLDSNFKFGLQHSKAEYYQPNNYQYIYYYPREDEPPYMDTRLANNLAKRIKSDDTLDAIYLKNRHELSLFNEDEYIEYGINISSKERISRKTSLSISKQSDAIVNDRELIMDIDTIYSAFVLPGYPYEYRPFLISTEFLPADYFDGYIDETSPYVSWMSRPFEDLEVVLGLRYVSLDQNIDQYKEDSENNSRLITKETSSLAIDDLFPSLSLKYKYSEKQYFDFAVSKTYIMPDMREFTEGRYNHPSEVAIVVGNPDLVNTLIYSVDFKYSYFYSENENVKLGLFYKYLDKPIEDVQYPSTSLPVYSFINSDSATLYGFEIDGRKKLDFIDSSLAQYYVSGNFSYNFSEVTLTEEQKEIYTSDTRELQGLSPYVFNFTLGYDNEKRSASFNFNYMAERIRKVGFSQLFDNPDQYETPPMLLDFVWIEKFNYGYDFEFKSKIGNILDQKTEWKEGENITRSYNNGRTLSMGLSAKF